MHVADLSTILAGIIYSANLGIWSKPVPPMSAWADVPSSNDDLVLDPNSSRALCRSQFLGKAGDDKGSGTGDDGDSGCDDGDGGDSN